MIMNEIQERKPKIFNRKFPQIQERKPKDFQKEISAEISV